VKIVEDMERGMATSPFVTSDSDDRELLTLTEELERAIHPPSEPTHLSQRLIVTIENSSLSPRRWRELLIPLLSQPTHVPER